MANRDLILYLSNDLQSCAAAAVRDLVFIGWPVEVFLWSLHGC